MVNVLTDGKAAMLPLTIAKLLRLSAFAVLWTTVNAAFATRFITQTTAEAQS